VTFVPNLEFDGRNDYGQSTNSWRIANASLMAWIDLNAAFLEMVSLLVKIIFRYELHQKKIEAVNGLTLIFDNVVSPLQL
jgi:hypothetical protein